MIYEGLKPGEGPRGDTDPTRGPTLILLALATSIDAFAVGTGLGVMETPILVPALLFGGVTLVLCVAGMAFGRGLGMKFGRSMTVAGGIVLVGIGIKILAEHL